jgi:ceramide glucosyltransferase
MTVAWLIVSLGVVVGTGYYAFSLFAAWAFFRRRRREAAAGPPPPVTILKPLKGLGVELEANLESFCTLDYPEYQIVFGVADPDDPAVGVVERIRRRHPARDIALVVDAEPIGANRKVANLAHMMRRAKHDILVLSDSDIRVAPDYLRQVVAPFTAPDVGLVTCLYRGVGKAGGFTRLESLFVNTDFMPSVLVAQLVEDFRYAFGATIAMRRQALDAIGGFEAIADHLADDFQLGCRTADAGFRLVLSPHVVETHLDASTAGDLARHQLRWARTYRVCRPRGYFLTILTHGTSWAALFLLLSGFSGTGWQVLLCALGVRLVAAGTIAGAYLGSRQTLRDLWLVPVKDLLLTAVWLASFLGNEVEWGGERFVVGADGLMQPLRPGSVVPVPALGLGGRALPAERGAGAQITARDVEPRPHDVP